MGISKFEQAKQIASGATNFMKMKLRISEADIESLQKKRFAVCSLCEFRDTNNNSCKECGCFLAMKTRSPTSSCPKDYWKKIDKKE